MKGKLLITTLASILSAIIYTHLLEKSINTATYSYRCSWQGNEINISTQDTLPLNVWKYYSHQNQRIIGLHLRGCRTTKSPKIARN